MQTKCCSFLILCSFKLNVNDFCSPEVTPRKLRLPKAANSENNEVATIGTLRYHFKEISFSSERVGVMNQSIARCSKHS